MTSLPARLSGKGRGSTKWAKSAAAPAPTGSSIPSLASASTFAAACERTLRHTLRVFMPVSSCTGGCAGAAMPLACCVRIGSLSVPVRICGCAIGGCTTLISGALRLSRASALRATLLGPERG
jgi:hypothetical protein